METNLSQLNKEQQEAVQHQEGPLLIVAGAGTGKTMVITKRIAYLIERGLAKPEEVLALTFTEKAAAEMEERLDRDLALGYTDLWVSTFHSFAEKILRADGLHIGLSTDFKLQNDTSAWVLTRQNLSRFKLNYYKPLSQPNQFLRAMINHFAKCKDQLIYPADYLDFAENLKTNLPELPEESEEERLKELALAFHTYQEILLENNVLDFSDLIYYCLKLFQDRPVILKKYQDKFKYILVDEFQDTNFAQYQLVKLLVGNKANLAVCADDFQAIYKFRGASFTNIIQFKKDFPKVKEVSLTCNYRSCQEILDLSYNFIKDNDPSRLKFFPQIEKKLQSQTKEEAIIEHLHLKTLEKEARAVVEKIIALKTKDKQAQWRDFVVLVRANSYANPFIAELEKQGLPFQFLASRGLYQKPIILDIVAYFKLLDNYHESAALYRVLNFPFFNIPHQDISLILSYSQRKAKSLFDCLNELYLISGLKEKTQTTINKILVDLRKHSQTAKEKKVSEVIAQFLRDSGYLQYLTSQEKYLEIELLNKFYKKIKDFEEQVLDPSLFNFMKYFDLELEAGETGEMGFDLQAGPDVIKIMTIHSAKGLEFKYVFLVNMVERRFPSSERAELIEIPQDLVKDIKPEGDVHLQEERRLCYVALTRAKKGLFLTTADDYGGKSEKKLSRFLIEMGFSKAKAKSPTTASLIAAKEPKKIQQTKLAMLAAVREEIIPETFSYSGLQPFNECPLKYKFSRYLKNYFGNKAVFSFGRAIHNTLYEFVKKSQEAQDIRQGDLFVLEEKKPTTSAMVGSPKNGAMIMSFEDLLETYEAKWIDDWFESQEQKQEYKKLGKKILKNFYDNYIANPPNVFRLSNDLALEAAFKFKIGDFIITGKIDRIDLQADGSLALMDYKTGKAKEKLNPDDKEQLLIYQIAMEEMGYKVGKLSYYYLEEGRQISFIGSDIEKEKVQQKIISQIQELLQTDFHPQPGFHCQYCDFKNICEFRQ